MHAKSDPGASATTTKLTPVRHRDWIVTAIRSARQTVTGRIRAPRDRRRICRQGVRVRCQVRFESYASRPQNQQATHKVNDRVVVVVKAKALAVIGQ